MGGTRLNHAVLYVRDLDESAGFYNRVLGLEPVVQPRAPAVLPAPDSNNDHDLGLFELGAQAGASEAGRSTVGLYHLAWEVDTLQTLAEIAERLRAENALVGATDHGTTKALYGRDPNEIEFEVCWLVPAEFVDEDLLESRKMLRRLDIAAEIERYGADTRGGIGISVPA